MTNPFKDVNTFQTACDQEPSKANYDMYLQLIDEEVEELDEAAELKKIGKDGKIHPVEMPNGEDGKASPALQKSAAHGGELLTIGKGGKEQGGKVKAPEQMSGFKHPGEGAELNKAPGTKK